MNLAVRIQKLSWYASRLAAMSPGEVLHRLREHRRKRHLSSWKDGWTPFEGADLRRFGDLSFLKERLAYLPDTPVDEWLTDPSHLGRCWHCSYPLHGAGQESFWHFDPVSRQSWPGIEAGPFEANVRMTSAEPHETRPYGDVKYVWEPNRLQVFLPLSAHAAKGSDGALTNIVQITDSWMRANPPFRGVNWFSGIEIAIRICSIFLAASVCNEHSTRKKMAALVFAHAHWLEQMPSLYSSANNHRVAEGLGLFLAGILLPDNDKARGWSAEGRRILESECLLQILGDGVGAEQSPTYQAFTMELIGFGAFVAKNTGQPFSAEVIERLARGARFLSALQACNGKVAAIGDDDEGRLLTNPASPEPLYVASVCKMIAALCGATDIISHQPGYAREVLVGCRDGDCSDHPDCLMQFSSGGYTVVRETMGARRIHLVFDHGPLGYLKLAAHGHSDALAIWLSVDGVPFFADAGTWLYHSGEKMRQEIRRSQFHNTLSLPGLSQSEPSAAFSWRNNANAKLEGESRLLAGDWLIAASHDGYLKRKGIVHCRSIERRPAGFAVIDQLKGASRATAVELSFLCGENVMAEHSGEKIWLKSVNDRSDAISLWLKAPAGFTADIFDSKSYPDFAFASTGFGQRKDAMRIVLKGNLGEDRVETLIQLSEDVV